MYATLDRGPRILYHQNDEGGSSPGGKHIGSITGSFRDDPDLGTLVVPDVDGRPAIGNRESFFVIDVDTGRPIGK